MKTNQQPMLMIYIVDVSIQDTCLCINTVLYIKQPNGNHLKDSIITNECDKKCDEQAPTTVMTSTVTSTVSTTVLTIQSTTADDPFDHDWSSDMSKSSFQLQNILKF